METKFNFNSQVCTDKIQSERLLSLGLKKETADMGYVEVFCTDDTVILRAETLPEGYIIKDDDCIIPAWSLHRLLSLLPLRVYEDMSIRKERVFDNILDLNLDFDFGLWYKGTERSYEFFDCEDLYESAI